MNFRPSYITALSPFVLLASLAVAEGKKPLERTSPPVATKPSEEEIIKRTVIPHVPFPQIDPKTSKYVKDEDLIEAWNGTMVTAKSYYDKLNSMEKELNSYGYSLKNSDDYALVKRVLLDYKLIDNNRALSEDLRALTDDGVLERLKDPAALRKIVQDETAQRLERYIDKIYKTSLDSPFGDIGMPDLILDPKLVKTRDKNLKAVIEKYYNDAWGDTNKLGVKADAFFAVEGDSAYARIVARSSVDGYLVGAPLNIANVFAEGKMPEKGKATFESGIRIIGYDVLAPSKKEKEVEDPAAAQAAKDAIKKNVDSYLWSLSPKDFGLNPEDMKVEFRQGVPVMWTWAVVTVEGELGIYGNAGFNFDVHMANLSVAANIGPEAETGVFCKVTGKVGVGPFSVAEAGVNGDITLMKHKTKLEGGSRLIFENGEPVWVTNVKAYNKVSALQGSMYVFANYKVPKGSLPPWEEKTFRHDIYNGGDAVELPEMVLYNYEKRVGLSGYSLFGAPKPEDTSGIDLDNSLSATFLASTESIAGNHQRVVDDLQNQVKTLESNRGALLQFLKDMKP
jgi:hypothetical protein